MKMEWNAGGWFGSQLGGTVWILIAAAISLAHDFSTSMILLMLFLLPNLVGLFLWYRKKLSCYQSMQIVLGLCGLAGLLAIFVLDRNDLWLEIQKGGAISKETGYVLLAVTVTVVMAIFHLRFGRKSDDPPI